MTDVPSTKDLATTSEDEQQATLSTYQADVNGALNIADRYPAGESTPKVTRILVRRWVAMTRAGTGPH
jgi:transposase